MLGKSVRAAFCLQLPPGYRLTDENGRKAWAMDELWAQYWSEAPSEQNDDIQYSEHEKQQQQQQQHEGNPSTDESHAGKRSGT